MLPRYTLSVNTHNIVELISVVEVNDLDTLKYRPRYTTPHKAQIARSIGATRASYNVSILTFDDSNVLNTAALWHSTADGCASLLLRRRKMESF